VKIGDWGLSREAESDGSMKSTFGTKGYDAPE
jgi:serine/threonine protein kinase